MRLTFCAVCGSSESLEHHHFMPLSRGGPDIEANILTLCSTHHGQMHAVRRASDHAQLTREGLAKRAWLGLGSPNPHAGGAATKAVHDKRREALRPWLAADLSHADAAAAMNAAGLRTMHGKPWSMTAVRAARRASIKVA
jgi:HNH endonuclease